MMNNFVQYLLHVFNQIVTSKASPDTMKAPATINFHSPVGAWNSAKV